MHQATNCKSKRRKVATANSKEIATIVARLETRKLTAGTRLRIRIKANLVQA